MNAVSVSSAARRSFVATPARRPWIVWIALALFSAAIIIPALLYWQEAPLRKALRSTEDGDFADAFSRVSYFLDSHPQHSEALALKARLLVEFGRFNEAIEIFDQVGAATSQDLHAWAKAYLKAGRLSHALPLLAQVVELDRENVDALYELAAARIRLGLLEEALPTAKRLASIPGYEGRGQVFLAAIYNDLGDHGSAAVAYGKVLQASPDASNLQLPADELLLQYAAVLVTLGSPENAEKAIELLERSVAARPTPAGYTILGNTLSQNGRNEEAHQAWQTALELDPNNRHARESLANAALQDGDADAAMEWLKPLELRDDLRASTAYLFQRMYLIRKNDALAEKWKSKAAKLREDEQLHAQIEELQLKSPRSFWANILRAYQFAQAGNWQQAEDMMRELAPDAPNEPFVRDLDDAVRRHGELPPLTRLPFQKH